MFAIARMPSTTAVLTAYTTFTASTMLVRSVINEVRTMTNQIIPQKLQEMIFLRLGGLFGNITSRMIIIIEESNGINPNEIYQASEIYLATKIIHSAGQLKVSKAPKDRNFLFTMNKGEKITDEFEGIQIIWEFVCTEMKKSYYEDDSYTSSIETSENRSYRLSFHKKYKEKVLNTYLQYVVERSRAIKQEKKVVKLHAPLSGSRESIILEHPFTFDTLAIDPKLKKELIEDLDRFLRRRDFYRRVGKAWKRGYLLYGPPGTGKSSLVAAMANYLKFDIYDLELTSVRSNGELRRLLLSTGNRSILVIEDIDCSIELQDRQDGGFKPNDHRQLTLSGLLNVIDGLWSSCGDERIIVFTTNYKDRLDPALLRPGRMDMHIHMSYLTRIGFKILAFNYLQIRSHRLFKEIEELIEEVEVTPAEIAEELMRGEDADVVLEGVVQSLLRKKELKYEAKDGKESKEEEGGLHEVEKVYVRTQNLEEAGDDGD